jgi:hypothetical protein
MINQIEKTQSVLNEQLFLSSLPEFYRQKLSALIKVRQIEAGEVRVIVVG